MFQWNRLSIASTRIAHIALEGGIVMECVNLLLNLDFRCARRCDIRSLQLPQETILHLHMLIFNLIFKHSIVWVFF